MKILSNKFYNELVNSNSRLQSKLNAEISENTFLEAENASKNITIVRLHEKALKYDAELERKRVKNQKYRDAKKSKKSEVPEVSDIEKFVKENLGKKILLVDVNQSGFICGHDLTPGIILGFKNTFGWLEIGKEKEDILLKKYKSYWYVNIEEVKQQLSKTK